jgi:hypothetical protein
LLAQVKRTATNLVVLSVQLAALVAIKSNAPLIDTPSALLAANEQMGHRKLSGWASAGNFASDGVIERSPIVKCTYRLSLAQGIASKSVLCEKGYTKANLRVVF